MCRVIEGENRNAGKLPPAFGNGGMLKLVGPIGSAQPGTFTKHKLFASKAAYSGPNAHSPMTSGPFKVVRKNDRPDSKGEGEDVDDDEGDGNGSHIPRTIPPLLVNAALARAVSETQVAASIEEWEMEEKLSEVFKVFSVLVEPPPDLSLDAIEGLPDYLSKLCDCLMNLTENWVRLVATRCWWITIGAFIDLYLYK